MYFKCKYKKYLNTFILWCYKLLTQYFCYDIIPIFLFLQMNTHDSFLLVTSYLLRVLIDV